MTDTTARASSPRTARSAGPTIYSVLIGLTSLGVLLQAVWAGIFLEHDKRPDKWVNVHAHGAEVTVALAVLALVAAAIWLRRRKDLLIGTVVLVLALVVEAYIGGRITNDGNDTLTAVHVPLAMAVMGLAVWLPVRIRHGRARSA